MRETVLSNCERDFILNAITARKRLDGRDTYDYRPLKISFGKQRGCCFVQLGNTRVMAQVSCDVSTPKQTRPTEGLMFINVELSPMAAPHFETGRPSQQCVEISRILEKCLKESRCVDTEALCIMAGIKVWSIRVDVHILNHAGNLTDAASIAAITALAHFRRPDFSVSGEEVTIHAPDEVDPLPLSIHHMPLCVTFAFYHQGKHLLVDPEEKEERVMEGSMVIGTNKHREICTLQTSGSMLLVKDQVLRCSHIAFQKVKDTTELIHEALENDKQARARGEASGFAMRPAGPLADITEMKADAVDTEMHLEKAASIASSVIKMTDDSKVNVAVLATGTAQIGSGGASSWDLDEVEEDSNDDDDDESSMEINEDVPKQLLEDSSGAVIISSGDASDGSEEEETVIMHSAEIQKKSGKEDNMLIDLTKALKRPATSLQTQAKNNTSVER